MRRPTSRFYRDHGCDEIPPRGPLAALTVPGAIGGWMLAREAAHSFGGQMPLDVLLGAAMRHARDGYVVTRSQAQLKQDKLDELKDLPGFAATFLIDGKVPKAGSMLKQSALAATLDHLTHAGLADFYRGDIGREIAADLERIGSPVTRADLEGYTATVEAPLSAKIEAGTLYNTPPSTQGLASLIILALYERLRVVDGESFEHIHGLVEATKRAFRVRDRIVTDPARMTASPQTFLENAFLDADVRKIDRRKAAPWPARAGDGDTVWMGAADASGLVVSYIQSVYWEFGSGCVLPRTGVMMQNRGASFSLDPQGAEHTRAGPPSVPHAQSRARDTQGRPRDGLRHDGWRWPATIAGRDVHAACDVPPAARQGDRRAALAARPHLGLDTYKSAHGATFRRQPDRPAHVRRPRCRRAVRRLFRYDGARWRSDPAS